MTLKTTIAKKRQRLPDHSAQENQSQNQEFNLTDTQQYIEILGKLGSLIPELINNPSSFKENPMLMGEIMELGKKVSNITGESHEALKIGHNAKNPANKVAGLLGLAKDYNDIEVAVKNNYIYYLLVFWSGIKSALEDGYNTENVQVDNFVNILKKVLTDLAEGKYELPIKEKQRKKVNIKFNLDKADLSTFATMNFTHVINFFVNCLRNSKEADANKIDITVTTDSKNLYVSIKDNGKGIPKAHRDKVFDLGFTSRGDSGGSGIGIGGYKRIINEMGGGVGFKTKTGLWSGTTFTAALPLER